jgi:hypothetical protein
VGPFGLLDRAFGTPRQALLAVDAAYKRFRRSQAERQDEAAEAERADQERHLLPDCPDGWICASVTYPEDFHRVPDKDFCAAVKISSGIPFDLGYPYADELQAGLLAGGRAYN